MRHFSKLFCFLLAFAFVGNANAQLSPGDIAFVGYDADGTDAVSFVALANISSGTVIKFTDNGWLASGSFRANEGTWILTFSSDVSCGTEVVVTAAGATDLQGGAVGVVTPAPGNALVLSTGGDQVLAYQGDEASPSFIAAINNEGAGVWQADATSSNTSALPAGLVDGMTAVALNEADNARYNCATESGDVSSLLLAINNSANWVGDNTNNQVPAGCAFAPTGCSAGPGGGGPTDCGELFISEYIEGSGSEKYIEVYNPTDGPVDLANYELRLYSNGNSSPNSTSNLNGGGVLPSGGVMVFKNSGATLFSGGVSVGAVNFNGDDAVELYNAATGMTADIFGVIGQDPGSAWTAAGGYSTANKTLRRIASVTQGITANPAGSFATLDTEWELYDQNTVDGLGFHIGDCVAVPTCLITGLTIDATSGCKDDGTDSQGDDYYLAKVTVTFSNAPTTGDLELYGPNGFITKVSVGSLSGGEAVFSNVELPANAMPVMVTASFSDEDCSADGLAPAVYPCSLPDCTPVINELDYNNPGTDDREFVEIYNPCTQPINLGDYSVIFVNGSNGQIYGNFQLPAVALDPGEFFVICGNGYTTPNCDLDVSPNTNLIQNGNPDAVALLYIQAIADAVSYEGSTNGFTEGSGDGLEDLATALRGIGRYVDGVDTDQNNADFSVQCVTPGEPNVSISQYCGLPADLSVSNIGCVGYNDAVYDDYLDTYSVTSICGHVYGGQDQVTFVGKETCGDAQIMARIAGVFPSYGYAGITMRESDAPGARKMSVIRYPNGYKYVEFRPYPNAPYQIFWLPSYTIYMDFVRINRVGDYFFCSVSYDGVNWTNIYQQYMAGMSYCVQSGMVLSAYAAGISTTADFTNVQISGSAAPPRPTNPVTINSDEPVVFSVFPNPATDELSVSVGNAPAEEATISILGLDGRELYRNVHNINGNTVNLQLSGLQMTPGMYILTVNTGEEVLTKRFVKANP
ncbi:MAG: lamin tail domain-containing protein [Phaeodactylibacter sp.]|nr:lamin tail domain-containing protein [Phaeodactylibacter sp.]MCB9264091.1 lamin tail domain-containing protein [Lewinellaceae bacterium]MCB9286711.1 lamin tail domain-containing protein [Lewinellaceae bacterium]